MLSLHPVYNDIGEVTTKKISRKYSKEFVLLVSMGWFGGGNHNVGQWLLVDSL